MIVVNLQDALHTMAHGQELLEHISDAVALQHTEDEPTVIVVEKVPDYPAGALARSVSPELFLAQLRGLGWAEIQFDLAG